MAVQGLTDIVDNFLSDKTHEVSLAKIEKASGKEQCQDSNDDEVKGKYVFISQYLIDDVLDQPGHDDVAQAGKGHADDGYNQSFFIGKYET